MAASLRWLTLFASPVVLRPVNVRQRLFVQKSPLKARFFSGLFLCRGRLALPAPHMLERRQASISSLTAESEPWGLTSSPITAACSNPSAFSRRKIPLVWSFAQVMRRPPLV